MKIKPASYKGFPEKDKFGNIFVAGSFKPEEEEPSFDFTYNFESA